MPVHVAPSSSPPGTMEARSATSSPGWAAGGDDLYHGLLHSFDHGFAMVEVLFDEDDRASDFRFLEVNAVFEEQTGLRDATGRTMRELVPHMDEHWFTLYGNVVRTGEPVRIESVSNELGRWFSLYAERVGDPAAHLVAAIFSDITARKRSDDNLDFLLDLSMRLAALEEEREIVETTTTALGEYLDVDRCYFVECDPARDLVCTSLNWCRAGTRSVEGRYALHEFGGIEWWRRYSGGDFAVEDVTRHAFTRDHARPYDALGIRAYVVQPFRREGDCSTVLAVTESAPRAWRPDEVQLVESVVARVWPLVERARADLALAGSRATLAAHARELEERVKLRTALLEETIAELETFSYSISHDLRSPLRAMRTYAGLLLDRRHERLGEEEAWYLDRIVEAADRMDRLIQDVLVYSSVSRAEVTLERIALAPFIEGIVRSYPDLSDARRAITLAPRLGAVMASAAPLAQCVAHLLGNAVKYARAGVPPEVIIWSTAAKGRTHLFVRDNGIGVAAEDRDRIFDMFYRGESPRCGTGMGLAIARRAAERMGGSLALVSADGPGATFDLELESAA